MRDLVSIITPVYNGEKFLEQAIISVLNQTYEHWELIIVNDCSNDKSQDVAEKYAAIDKRIIVIELKQNSGVANARNIGIQNSTGNFIAFLDSDDLWKPNKLSIQLEFMKKNNLLFTYSNYELINNFGEKLNKIITSPLQTNYQKLLKGNSIGCLTVMIDKKIGTVMMPLVRHEDYATWLLLLKNGHAAFGIQETLAMYRKTNGSISSNKIKTLSWTWFIYRKIIKLNLQDSIKYMLHFIFNTSIKYLRR